MDFNIMEQSKNQNIKIIIAYYGGKVKMASELGVTYQTLYNWVKGDRKRLLMFLPELKKKTNLSIEALYSIIMH